MSHADALPLPRLSARAILVRYVGFAVIAGVANLATQEGVIRLLPILPLMISILAGTGVGFIVKYVLEKRWVFFDAYESHTQEARKLALYGVFGVGTTLLFWGAELGFWLVWQTATAKYIGGALGLAVGNWIKYLLDKHYVFGQATR